MWLPEFKNLEHLKDYILENLSLDEKKGFIFSESYIGMDILNVDSVLGKASYEELEDDAQQALYYYAIIDHPTLGKDKLNKATLKYIAYQRDPLEIIQVHIKYIDVGEYAEMHRNFIISLITDVEEKFGKADKKSLKVGKSKIIYKIKGSELNIWQSFDGLRIQISNKR